MVEYVQVIAGLLLGFFLPGFTLLKLLFPRPSELDISVGILYQIVLGTVMSIVIVVLVSFVLGGPTIRGINTLNLYLTLGSLTLVFFFLGWWRGAYPVLGRLHPALMRAPPKSELVEYSMGEMDNRTLLEFQHLAKEKHDLKKDLRKFEKESRLQTGETQKHYSEMIQERTARLEAIDNKIRELEKQRARELY